MIFNWQSCFNTYGKVGVVLMDLSKSFDCLPHDLLIAKMVAYSFGHRSLRLFYNYLSDRKHRVRIGSSFREFLEILLGVPQGTVLGPILLNIFINDLLFSVTEGNLCNFADNNTLYVCDQDIAKFLLRLNEDLLTIVKWFESNGMVTNPNKFQVIFPGTEDKSVNVNIGSTEVTYSKEVKLLEVVLDTQLTFYPHIKEICKKATSKTKALVRVRSYLSQKQADHLYNAYIMPSFNYCPLVWMYCSKQAHNLINATHRRALCAKLNTFSGTLIELQERSSTVSIHTKNFQLLMIEVFKSMNQLNTSIMWDAFHVKSSKYNLRRGISLMIPRANSVRGLNSIAVRAALAWNHLPSKEKEENAVAKFKSALKEIRIYCRCKLCYT